MNDDGARTAEPAEAQLRAELVAAAAGLANSGMSPGSSGNISVRHGERIILSPTGSDLAALDPDALSVLDFDGTLLDGPKPSKEYPFHRAFYRRDPTARAVVHVHSLAACAYSCLAPWSQRSAVPPLTPYFVMRVGQTPLIPYADPGDTQQADDIEALDLRFRAALLQNHGSIATGRRMDEAVQAITELEHTCALLLQLGDRQFAMVPPEAVRRLADKYDSPWD